MAIHVVGPQKDVIRCQVIEDNMGIKAEELQRQFRLYLAVGNQAGKGEGQGAPQGNGGSAAQGSAGSGR